MDREEIWDRIEQSDMILVGLGEEFDGIKRFKQQAGYGQGCECLKEEGLSWLIPAWNEYCMDQAGDGGIGIALEKLEEFLKGKNHFVVSVSTNSKIAHVGRNVMPCGSVLRKQCAAGCRDVLQDIMEDETESLKIFFRELAEGRLRREMLSTGTCPECGAPLVLNNIHAENYNENGYLNQWNLYMKWLQGTLNHRLLVLELGVGMRFPTVIRWPFEKAAFFNQKAYFYRVNENLYQLTKELAGKGCGISEDAVAWLAQL
ncbi:MAG TPA: hypothetical protein DCZ91_05100 [Lachnospiraceae bacterium]|nr:hypothetical protein [Lachnospiraceae bacterium]